MGNKHKIIVTQEETFDREIVEVESMGEKIWDYKIGETLKRNKGERKGTIK